MPGLRTLSARCSTAVLVHVHEGTALHVVTTLAIALGVVGSLFCAVAFVAEIWQRSTRGLREVAAQSCSCGNGPLTKEDREAGGRCICCRTKHLFYHDDRRCRRCGCPYEVAWGADSTNGYG